VVVQNLQKHVVHFKTVQCHSEVTIVKVVVLF